MSPIHRNTKEISAIGRSVEVLREFLRPSAHMTTEELVRRTDLPKTTVHRIVAELVRIGLLERVASGLQLGTLLFELGQFAPRARTLREAARPILTDLSHATNMNVGLGVLDGTDVVYVDLYAGRDAPRQPQQSGTRWPAHASCSGKAILAHAGDEAVEAVLDAGMRQLTPRTITSRSDLLAELEEIRRKGAAYDRGESFLNVAAVGVPVFAPDGSIVAAVSISGLAGRINLQRFDVAARASAIAIARLLASGAGARTSARGWTAS